MTDGSILPNANVTLVWCGLDDICGNADDVTWTTTSDADGKFSFASLPGGHFTYKAKNPATGDETETFNVTLDGAMSGSVHVELELPIAKNDDELAYTGSDAINLGFGAGLIAFAGLFLVASRRKYAGR